MTLQSFTSGNEFHFSTGMGSERNLSKKWKQGGEEMEGSYGYICGMEHLQERCKLRHTAADLGTVLPLAHVCQSSSPTSTAHLCV